MAVPLRKKDKDGNLYQRRGQIEQRLDALATAARADIAELCEVHDQNAGDYLPSECLLHLVRACRTDNSDRHFERLFRTLRLRVIARLPRGATEQGAEDKRVLAQRDVKIAEYVLDRFQAMLVNDRGGYDERLDYFEVNFDDGIAALRLSGRRKALKEENRAEPMTYDDETSELNAEIEKAAADQNWLSDEKYDDPAYRSVIFAAIDSLPEDERRIIGLLRLGIPFESKEPDVESIVKIVGCVEKTARNRRDRAFKAIRKAIEEHES